MRKIAFLIFLVFFVFIQIHCEDSFSTPKGQPNHLINNFNSKIGLDYPMRQLNITIIESQSEISGHDMDIHWLEVAMNLGHSAVILPQQTLDNTDFFATTNLLLISSGVIELPQNRRDIVEQYVQQGGNTYIQSEYLSSYTTNQLFQQIVINTGGVFQWGTTISGDLNPMNIMGEISQTPNAVPQLTYFWYGNEGSGDETIENYMEFNDQYFGFIFTAPDDFSGQVITNSDQDWAIISDEQQMLMQNILSYFSGSSIVSDTNQILPIFSLKQNYPNPFNPVTTISFETKNLHENSQIEIYNLKGQRIKVFQIISDKLGMNKVVWDGKDEFGKAVSSGVYLYQLNAGKYQVTKRMTLIK